MIFTNPFYYGGIFSDGELLKGAHEPMVTKDEFDRVRSILSSRSRQRPKRLFFTYSGLMTCGECGAAITAENKYKLLRTTGKRKKYVYYHCTKRKPGVKCSQRVIEEQELERQIEEFLKSVTISEPFLKWALDLLKTFDDDERERDRKIAASLERRIGGCQREISELLNIKLKGLLSDDDYLRKRNELMNESVGLKQQLTIVRSADETGIRKCRQVFEFAESALRRFRQCPPEAKRDLLGDIGSNWVLRDGKVLISAQKPLRVIHDFLETPLGRTVMFEPGLLGLDKARIDPENPTSFTKLRFLNDVRTAVRKTRKVFFVR
jgi:hypothetical protein